MDFLSLAIAVVGLGLQATGAVGTEAAASQYNRAQVGKINLEQKAEDVRRRTMEIDARRRSLQALREQQQKSALALNNATTQGAQFGSGLQGGRAQVSGQGNFNQEGIMQSLMAGRETFDINSQISQQQIAMANAQKSMQFSQGLGSAGKSLLGTIGPLKQLTGLSGNSQGGSGDSYGGGFGKE